MSGKRELAVRGRMIERAVQTARYIERNILICTAVVDTLTILIFQEKGLTAEVHFGKTLAGAAETLVVLTLK